jgi:hypothetical protein
MKRISVVALVCFALMLPIPAVSQEQITSPSCTDKTYILAGGADATTRVCGEHQTVSVYIPSKTAVLSVHDLRKKSTAKQAYKLITKKNTILIASGGFFWVQIGRY